MIDIYSDIRGEVLTNHLGRRQVYLYGEKADKYNPSLILPDELAVKNMIDFLQNTLKDDMKK